MFRRKLFLPLNAVGGVLQSSRRFIIPEDPVERSKEKELRQRVLQTYRGMQIPELSNAQYGHFAPEAGVTSAAVSQAYSSAKNSSFTAPNYSGGKRVDWLMLFTGLALVYASSKLILKQLLGGDLGDVTLPLWTASVETHANHLLFTIQFDTKEREEIKNEYLSVRRSNPFVNFFQWLRVRHPNFGYGLTYSYDAALATLIAALSSKDTQSSIIIARGVQNALRNRKNSSAQRIDDFLASLGTLSNSVEMGLGNSQVSSNISLLQPSDTTPLYGTEHVTLQSVFEVSESEQHSSVPFEQH